MNESPKIAIIGSGAVGAYYGALLQQAGNEVHFLFHSDYEHVKQHGLRVDSLDTTMQLDQVNAYQSTSDMPACDLIVIALKTTQNGLLDSLLKPIIHAGTTLLTLQNGLGLEEQLCAISPSSTILGGLCFICSQKKGPGHIHHMDYGLITLGEYTSESEPVGITDSVRSVETLLKDAGVKVQPIEDLIHARWKKLVWNIPFNGHSVVENKLTNELLEDPITRKRCIAMMHEVAAASQACSQPIDESFIQKMVADTESMKPYAPSMKLDFDHGRPLEIECIYKNPLEQATAAGVNMPETQKLYDELCGLTHR